MIPDLNVLIVSSVALHFMSTIKDLETYLEGDPHRPSSRSYAEIRYDGPIVQQLTGTHSQVNFEVNVLVTTVMEPQNGDLYAHARNVDKARNAFVDIPILRGGVVLDCANLKQDHSGKDFVEVRQFGQVEPSILIEQATIEGHYTVEMEG